MSERVFVVGACGFGREALDRLDAMIAAGVDIDLIGVVDDGPTDVNLAQLSDREVAYLGTLENWLTFGDYDARYVLGVGDYETRRQLAAQLDRVGFRAYAALPATALATKTISVSDMVPAVPGGFI